MTNLKHKIETLRDLVQAAKNRRAVYVPTSHPWSKPKPAAVVLQLQGAMLHRLFEMGMYIYEKKERARYGKRNRA